MQQFVVQQSLLGRAAGDGLFTNQAVGRDEDVGPYCGVSLTADEVEASTSQYIASFITPPPLAVGHNVTHKVSSSERTGKIIKRRKARRYDVRYVDGTAVFNVEESSLRSDEAGVPTHIDAANNNCNARFINETF